MGLLNSITSAASNAWSSARSTVSNVINSARSTVSSTTTALRNTVHNLNTAETRFRNNLHRDNPTLSRIAQVGEALNGISPIGQLTEGSRIALSFLTGNTSDAKAQFERQLMRNNSTSTGFATGVASIFGENAENWVRSKIAMTPEQIATIRRGTGLNLEARTDEQRDLLQTAETTGYVGGFVATFAVPGGVAVKGVSLSLRGASMASKATNLTRVAESTAALSTRVNTLNSSAFLTSRIAGTGLLARTGRGATWLGFELGMSVIDDAVLGSLVSPLIPNASSPSGDGNAGDFISSPHMRRISYADNGGTTTANIPNINEDFTTRAQDNRIITNESIAEKNIQVRNAINPTEVSETDKESFRDMVVAIANDLDRKPAKWGDPRIEQMQIALFALGYGRDNAETGKIFSIDGIMLDQTKSALAEFKLDHRTRFDPPSTLATITTMSTQPA